MHVFSVVPLASNEKEADPNVPVASNAEQHVESYDKDSQLSNDENPEGNDFSEEEDSDDLSDPNEGDLSDEGNAVVEDQGALIPQFSY